MNTKPCFPEVNRFTRLHLEESNGEDTGEKAEKLAADDGRCGGTGVWLNGGRWSGNSGVGLDLAVGNLGNGAASWSLDLAIADLGHWGASWCLDLAISCQCVSHGDSV